MPWSERQQHELPLRSNPLLGVSVANQSAPTGSRTQCPLRKAQLRETKAAGTPSTMR